MPSMACRVRGKEGREPLAPTSPKSNQQPWVYSAPQQHMASHTAAKPEGSRFAALFDPRAEEHQPLLWIDLLEDDDEEEEMDVQAEEVTRPPALGAAGDEGAHFGGSGGMPTTAPTALDRVVVPHQRFIFRAF